MFDQLRVVYITKELLRHAQDWLENVGGVCNDKNITTRRKDSEMDYLDLETVTNTKCVMCGDTLADWEERVCILCEVDEELDGE